MLTHVCAWTEHGWKRISVQEASRLHPGGTVSAKSGLFMCELCGQYVTLTDGPIRDRYFKHTSDEKSKDCPDRTEYIPVPKMRKGAHSLPIKIKNITHNEFELEIGFIPVPEDILQMNTSKMVTIKPTVNGHIDFKYSLERMRSDITTYLSVGSNISEQYHIDIDVPEIRAYWPVTIDGFLPEGAVFDSETYKKVPYDGDVKVNHKYYLLTAKRFFSYGSVNVTRICTASVAYKTWYIYELTATDMDDTAAKFFLDIHYRLTENSINMYPVWPPYIRNPYVIRHNRKEMSLLLSGNISEDSPLLYPTEKQDVFVSDGFKFIKLSCNDRQQTIYAGRTKVLQYTYLWREELDGTAEVPKVSVTDMENRDISSPEATMPSMDRIIIEAAYDGFVEIYVHSRLTDQIKINGGSTVNLDVSTGHLVKIYQGKECVWQTEFVNRKKDISHTDETALIEKLDAYSAPFMSIPANFGNIVFQFNNMPQLKLWLGTQRRNGRISVKAYKTIRKYLSEERNR